MLWETDKNKQKARVNRLWLGAQRHNGSAPSAGFSGSISEFGNKRSSRQDRAHNLTLNSDSAPMNDAQRPEPQPVRLGQILLHHSRDVAGRHAVQIEDVCDRDTNGFIAGLHGQTWKSP